MTRIPLIKAEDKGTDRRSQKRCRPSLIREFRVIRGSVSALNSIAGADRRVCNFRHGGRFFLIKQIPPLALQLKISGRTQTTKSGGHGIPGTSSKDLGLVRKQGMGGQAWLRFLKPIRTMAGSPVYRRKHGKRRLLKPCLRQLRNERPRTRGSAASGADASPQHQFRAEPAGRQLKEPHKDSKGTATEARNCWCYPSHSR